MVDPVEVFEIVCAVCDTPELVGKVRIVWNSRFISRMGDARWSLTQGRGLIRLSRPLWPKASEEERMETVIHEACHIIADYKFGSRQIHGPRWQQMMRLCGYENPRRCHRVDLETIRARRQDHRIRAACGCAAGVTVGPVQARKIRTGTVYRCRSCNEPVRLG